MRDADHRQGQLVLLPTGNTAGAEGKKDDWLLKSWAEENPGIALVEIYFAHELHWVRKEEYEEYMHPGD